MKKLLLIFLLFLVGCIPSLPNLPFKNTKDVVKRGVFADFNVDTISSGIDFPLNVYLTNYRGKDMNVDLKISDGWGNEYGNVDYETSMFLDQDEYLEDQIEPDISPMFRYYSLAGESTTITLKMDYSDEVREEVPICIVKTTTKGQYNCLVDETITDFDDGSKASFGIRSVRKRLGSLGGGRIKVTLFILLDNLDNGFIEDEKIEDFSVSSRLGKFNCNLNGDINLRELNKINQKYNGIECSTIINLENEFVQEKVNIGYKYKYSVIISKSAQISE